MSAWFGLMPNVFMSQFHERALSHPLIGMIMLLGQGCEPALLEMLALGLCSPCCNKTVDRNCP